MDAERCVKRPLNEYSPRTANLKLNSLGKSTLPELAKATQVFQKILRIVRGFTFETALYLHRTTDL